MEGHGVSIVELTDKESGGYRLNVNKLEDILLRSDVVDKKVALISVAGAFRKGKSFLLNFFVHYLEWLESGGIGDEWFNEETVLDKFRWRGGSECDTLGIILWSKPYFIRDSHGREIVVLLMDTQGLFDNKSTVQHCVTIFAMSTLLTSIQIYNVSPQIQEDDLQNLQLFTEYAKLAKGESKTAPFQKLLFLVRDWPNSREYSYGYNGGSRYMNTVLQTSPNQKLELRRVRENLKSTFETMNCFLMPYPGQSIALNNSKPVLGDVEKEFKENISVFIPSIFRSLVPKTVNGTVITSRNLFNLFQVYADVFKNGKLPKPRSIFEATATAFNLACEELAMIEYETAMNEFLNSDVGLTEHPVLLQYHIACKEKAVKLFDGKPKLGGNEAIETHKKSLVGKIEKRFVDLSAQVEERRLAKEEGKRLENEKRAVEEENERIEEEKRQIEGENKRLEKEKRKMEDDAKRREEEATCKEEMLKRELELMREFIRKEEERMQKDRERSDAELQRLRKEQEGLRSQITELQNRQQEEVVKEDKNLIAGISAFKDIVIAVIQKASPSEKCKE